MGRDHGTGRARRVVRWGRVLYGADSEIITWVAARVPGYVIQPGAVALGVVRGGKVVAGVVYERCNGAHIEVSIAAVPGSRWADRTTLFRLFAYPFLDLGLEAITVLVAMSNLDSLNLATKLGFERVALVPFAATDGTPLVVLQMYRERCRWIGHGQIVKGADAA